MVQRLNSLPGRETRECDHGSNIFPLTFAADINTEKVIESLSRNQVFLYPDDGTDRITRLTVNTTILRQSNDAIFEAFESALKAG